MNLSLLHPQLSYSIFFNQYAVWVYENQYMHLLNNLSGPIKLILAVLFNRPFTNTHYKIINSLQKSKGKIINHLIYSLIS